ncbi:MAG: MBL fold metallo-hydrolase [Bacteroidia bacterium]|nr:MBL fold metallo-hydrolase [Bacteroidia bacterium]
MSLRIYGKLPSGERLRRIQASNNYKNGSFQNLSATNAMAEDANFFKVMKEFLNKPPDVAPATEIPYVKTDLKNLGNEPLLVWFGHSSYLLKIDEMVILVDPVFSGNAAPLSFMVKAFKGSNEYKADDFPDIDLLILTHDHYDHLDYKTISKLKPKVKQTCCTLGVGSHLEYWGIDKNIIEELDWWENYSHKNVHITSVPGRHFSGRGVKRGQSLWGGFVLKSGTLNLFLGGDSGYDSHFKEIGTKFGPFDLAILEAGQYNKSWPHIHMLPEETVEAARDLNAKKLLPVHWAKFSLAMHPWNEPIKRVVAKADSLNVELLTPLIGEAVKINDTKNINAWWDLV